MRVIKTKEFLEFAKSKPQGRKIEYFDTRDCPIAQFAKSLGYQNIHTDGVSVFIHDNVIMNIPNFINEATANAHTWGELVAILQKKKR